MPSQKINLRDRLEDNQLDLSMSDLDEVPVRDIAQIKKATSLDLSNNRLTSLGKNFATLTHIVKLDLSKNQLKELPENFGDLVQLKHLDLYSNQITHLPLSLGQLKALRWLDLKNNPLVPKLAEVVGPCLDAQQCQQSARKVVVFLQQMQLQVEEERLRRQQQKKKQQEMKEQAALEKKKEAQQQQQQQKKKKTAKANEKNPNKSENGIKMPLASPGGDSIPVKKDKGHNAAKHKKNSSKQGSGLLVRLLKILFFITFMTVISLFMLYTIDKERFLLLQETVLNLANTTIASLPEPVQKHGKQLIDTVEPIAITCYRHAATFSHQAYVKGEEFYIWFRTDETVQQYMESLRSIWDMLCVKVGETYRTISQQVPIYVEVVKKKLF
ncbi:leucine-rich repeat-containing protein 59 [Anabrus simplex]|uniref:leucine-rich repeat-containing protein 59 n=1 Tax=Anabrus simplex TaxID=316456 RepID=UPI0035A26D37